MEPELNPYVPGAGRRPRELAGRTELVGRMAATMGRCENGLGGRGFGLYGLRGVGKTVLLGHMAEQALERSWIVAQTEASRTEGVTRSLARQLHPALRDATDRAGRDRMLRALRVFRSFTLTIDPEGRYGFGFTVDPLRGYADSGTIAMDLADLLTQLGAAARDLGVGVLITIDELQEAPPGELEAINMAAHAVGQSSQPLPVLITGAGLPSLPATLAAANSYAERLFEYHQIEGLDEGSARAALTVPAREHGVEWSRAGLDAVAAASHGYPFAIQTCGAYTWDYATTNPITGPEADVGIARAAAEMDRGIYRARWDRATPLQRQLLAALAHHGELAAVPATDLASAIGKSRRDISAPRDELLRKGLVYAPDRGVLAFTVPGMADFIRRQEIDTVER